MLDVGLGTPFSVNTVLEPSIVPAGESPSTKLYGEPEPLPQGPDEPFTYTQSAGLPTTESTWPLELTMATWPAANPGAISGRAPRSATNPTTLDSAIGVVPVSVVSEPPDDAGAVRTSRTCSGIRLDGTLQDS